jgi:tripartite-type tricarboxylate transporter receptor subunit TctC
MMRFLAAALLAVLAGLAPQPAGAQAHSDRPIRLVVPFPPGGPPDLVGRVIAPPLAQVLGQPVIVDNRPGASGIVASRAVTGSAPDGTTLMIGSIATHGTNAAMFRDLPYDPIAGFTPIALVAESPLVLEVHPGFPAQSLADLVRAAREQSLFYGSNSIGSSAHLSGELFQLRTGIRMTHAPSRGSAALITDLIGGHIRVAIDNLPPSLPFIRNGQIRALAVTSATRWPALPEVPTMIKAGVPDFDVTAWYGIFAPPGLPDPITQRLNRAMNEVLGMPAVQARILDLGFTTLGGEPAALRERVVAQVALWRHVVATNNIEQQQ